jgi:hypothetical protein
VFVRRNAHRSWGLWIVPCGSDGTARTDEAEAVTALSSATSVDVDLPVSSDGRNLYVSLEERITDDVWLADIP